MNMSMASKANCNCTVGGASCFPLASFLAAFASPTQERLCASHVHPATITLMMMHQSTMTTTKS
jgi:hypothetical protein